MATRPPPLLLTKRLTSFLALNLSAHITSLLLLTPDGKLLAYASDPALPVTTLRTHGCVAASLYAIHSSGTDRETIDGALGAEGQGPRRGRAAGGAISDSSSPPPPLAVTIQLESGVVLVIRRLRCGMLFVCMGPPPSSSAAAAAQQQQGQQQQQQQQQQGQQPQQQKQHSQPGVAAGAVAVGGANGHGHQTPSTSPPPTHHPNPLGSPSEAASILSAATGQTTASSVMFGAGTAGVMATRRHAEELARWLDERLGALEVPEMGLGGVV